MSGPQWFHEGLLIPIEPERESCRFQTSVWILTECRGYCRRVAQFQSILQQGSLLISLEIYRLQIKAWVQLRANLTKEILNFWSPKFQWYSVSSAGFTLLLLSLYHFHYAIIFNLCHVFVNTCKLTSKISSLERLSLWAQNIDATAFLQQFFLSLCICSNFLQIIARFRNLENQSLRSKSFCFQFSFCIHLASASIFDSIHQFSLIPPFYSSN